MLADYVEARLTLEGAPSENIEIWKLTGKESISQLFSFEIDVVTLKDTELDLDTVVGSDATITFSYQPSNKEIRKLHGMIVEADFSLATEAPYKAYKLTMAPRAFRTTLVETQEIFLNKSIPDIIKEKLEKVGLQGQDIDMRLNGTYEAREFVVQFKETDLAFISRLAEHLGISFFFEHGDDRETMCFSDYNGAFQMIAAEEPVKFRGEGEERDVFSLNAITRLVPSTFVQQEYNYMKPRLDLTSEYELKTGYAGGVVEYGAHYFTPTEGKRLAQVRAEERGATRQVYIGKSDNCRFQVGSKFTLEGHPTLGQKDYLIVEIEHQAVQTVIHHAKEGTRSYMNTFRAIEADVPYRSPRRTPKPQIVGLIFGLVEPEAKDKVGKYSLIDEEGRYTVRFFFDTSEFGERTKSTLPIRMLQSHAGPDYGLHFPLKPGVEVMVAFVEGDPDRPFIVGAVPNPVTPSPVVQKNAILNRIESSTGVLIEMKDV